MRIIGRDFREKENIMSAVKVDLFILCVSLERRRKLIRLRVVGVRKS